GQVEAFLLERLDGSTTAGAIQTAFEAKFGEPLTTTELQEFVDLARSQGLVGTSEAPAKLASGIRGSVHNAWRHLRKQNPLFFRFRVFDPDRFLNWLEPRTRFLWSTSFAASTAVAVLAAMLVVCLNQHE